MAWAGRSPAVAESKHLKVKCCCKLFSPENEKVCTSSSTLFHQCREASEDSQSPALGVGLHTVVSVLSNTIFLP